jgi:hypothetical protein
VCNDAAWYCGSLLEIKVSLSLGNLLVRYQVRTATVMKQFSGLLRRVVSQTLLDVSEVLTAFIIRTMSSNFRLDYMA